MARRGSKPKPGRREPNGKLSRQVEDVANVAKRNYDKLGREEVETIAVGVSARERLWGITPSQSRDQMAGTYIGRLCLQGDVSPRQFDAAMMYAEHARAYQIAMRSPREPNAVDLNATKGGSGDYENVQATQQAVTQFEAVLFALQRANAESSNRGANLIGALAATVLKDLVLDHLVPDTRTALNVLARAYGLNAGRQAA